jgi:hypothetical protein
VITLVLLAALAFPSQQQSSTPRQVDPPLSPEQVLAWQLEGRIQDEIRREVTARGLAEYPEIAFLSARSAAGADAKTIRVVRHAKGPRSLWKWSWGLPKPTDYLYEVAGALLWGDLDVRPSPRCKEKRLSSQAVPMRA